MIKKKALVNASAFFILIINYLGFKAELILATKSLR